MHTHKILALSIALASFITPAFDLRVDAGDSYEYDFVLTAYYSPLQNQCCYVRGSLEADQELNGYGTHGADGTPVYPGMIAAPKSYAFGTRIKLTGFGTFTVHDRGGAITEIPDGPHRLDVWMGHGEEGLARALAFGVKRIRGTVYPVGSVQPAESVDITRFPSPLANLEPFATDVISILTLQPRAGDRTMAVKTLQQLLKDLGYFRDHVTGFFGMVTQDSLAVFLQEHGLEESSLTLTERAAAILLASAERKNARLPLTSFVGLGSTGDPVLRAQRTLRFLGYYRGRTSGQYDDKLRNAIMRFQKDHQLIADASSTGAGRIGPMTKKAIIKAWSAKHADIRSEKIIALHKIEKELLATGKLPRGFFGEGDKGDRVIMLQRFLAQRGFFPADQISGLFGPVTRKALVAFQQQLGIIQKDTDTGAGYVGPATGAAMKNTMQREIYQSVRAEGWKVL